MACLFLKQSNGLTALKKHTVEKGEYAGNQHFWIFHSVFFFPSFTHNFNHFPSLLSAGAKYWLLLNFTNVKVFA